MPQPKSKFNRKAWDEQIDKDQKEAYERKDDSGVFKSIFKDEIPKSAFWEHKEGGHQVNIIAYIVGENSMHPSKKPGDIALYFEVGVHKNIIPNTTHVCMASTFRKKCAYDDYQNELRKDTSVSKEVIKALYPQRRMLYNLEILDNPKEQARGILIFDIAQFLFQKPLEEQAILPLDGGTIRYAAPSGGKIITFQIKDGTYKNEKTGQSGKKQDFTSFHFLDRDPLDDSYFERAWKLDGCLYIPEYDEISDALHEVKPDRNKSYYDMGASQAEKERQEDVQDFQQEEEIQQEEQEEEQTSQEFACFFEGVIFGEDFNKYDECDACEIKIQCKELHDELNKPKDKPTPKPKQTDQSPQPRRRPGR